MATRSTVMNGEVPRGHSGTLEETLQQMNLLIQENRDLKEALHQTNVSMKERFEDLSVWREKQREERSFLEDNLEKARGRLEALAAENQELQAKVEEQRGGGPAKSEMDALCSQMARMQAEKNDLVAMNSELQLKAGQRSDEDSFIEIIRVTDEGEVNMGDAAGEEKLSGKLEASMVSDLTVSQLLQSLRDETKRVERLQLELESSEARVAALQEKMICSESSTQTSLPPELPSNPPQPQGPSEVEGLRAQMVNLFNELQHAQNKLDKAEGMKKGLQDRCRVVEQDVVTLRAQLVEKQAVQTENERLRLQVDSMQAQSQLEQRKSGEERKNLGQLKEAYTKLAEDYEEVKKRESESVPGRVVEDLQAQLTAAEQALAAKQEHIDHMKQEIFQKEEELGTISVFQAQAEVYSSDFYAERAAREKIHEEKEHLAAELDYTKQRNMQLQEEMESLGRHSLNEMQKRHGPRGGNPHGGAAAQAGRVSVSVIVSVIVCVCVSVIVCVRL
ncbi:hypothetical protein NHX12_020291 [Muraenolepis orangiensis]|uniref:Optineurin n=1 Tax=Muraenolepis orangiensis TaxID=630683 RepID=A0A9Q0ISV4_9TELE|nr:hypothetical protein NHX12_020291 [Muraenolepis orangiensis]